MVAARFMVVAVVQVHFGGSSVALYWAAAVEVGAVSPMAAEMIAEAVVISADSAAATLAAADQAEAGREGVHGGWFMDHS